MLALRLAPDAITVNCIAPGPIATKMTDRLIAEHPGIVEGNPLGAPGQADDVAGALVYLTARAGA